jgi:hypothetical protein
MILELGQISLARAGGIRPGRYQGRGRGRPRWTPAEIRPGSPDPGVPRTQVQSQRSNNYDFRVGQNFPGTCRWNPARPVPGARPRPPPRRSWEAVGLIVAPSLEQLWGACGSRETSQMRSRDFQETTRDDPNRLLGVPLEIGPPERGREPQGDNPGDPKEASRRRGAQVLINTKRG